MSFLSRPSRDHCFHRPIKISTGRVFQILRGRSIQLNLRYSIKYMDNLLSVSRKVLEIPGIFSSIGQNTISPDAQGPVVRKPINVKLTLIHD